ncbi:hypothetical protein EHI8A_129960 [Entamoeba histolytica HM-1:IMSS-B]|uniref:Uncharacterized protein n=5 Tax=Entamoeba histolytica TaxID=5759 RepID=C4MA53_ENTH1|nr:hypothetical protein EHI_172620 [Entamoeba histolytica HM-1:IMSS]EMH73466.1 hypothetical protein EHI8A_129960 [Entamoeba histolytica HM-1:IMSS-B]EMS11980.1 hypothetical protein KM1_201910 [Entamoeba histolytica HM-3:IMSS]ENY61423.1 hypothetical protein EHI7A_119910 [Entamoeba histolytica HM-1:IMSS-A]GAT98637.1 hypothetical protein CL6EHI_172620 [Entamoeba histolytica]EAL43473.1 hypothetical protein EHI_172620 [Entamoeba histolytica HM-1:IMSS]|eukprot:XP_648858.1 hypothetical protein EHI_172620 [Entamoeba histolytica HM-1:IMSS]
MNTLILVFIITSFGKQCNEYKETQEDTVDGAFECINTFKTTEKENVDIITGLKEFLESYVYKDILKNPPQPSFSNNYYEKVDIDSELNKINTKTTHMYDFYSEIYKLLVLTRDSHLSFTIDEDINTAKLELTYFYYFLPFVINIERNKKMYLIPITEIGGFKIKYPQELVYNMNQEVKTINGKDPFTLIREFGKKYIGLKCPHAQFTHSKASLSFGSLASTPLPKDYLKTPITITWKNGANVTISYSILKIQSHDITVRKLLKGEQPKYGIKRPLIPLEIKERNQIHNRLKIKKEIKEQYISDDRNVYFIFPKNGGGNAIYSQWVQKILASYVDVNDIESGRISEFTEIVLKAGYGNILFNPKTCEQREKYVNPKTLGQWYTNPNIIKYGDIEHKVSQPSSENWDQMKVMKHPRKPTEIIIYTDSFCYSACSEVTKGLKEWGSAILVGFDGDPNGKDDEFEVGLSPTAVMSVNEVLEDNIFTHYGYDLGISILESYRYNYNYNETIPREFLPDIIDERVNIYEYSDRKIDEFEYETKRIIEKYQTKCNPKNKRLVKRDEKCDLEIKIKHGHGGYECGDNGEWSTHCVLSYCDDGYKFDSINMICILDPCEHQSPSSSGVFHSFSLNLSFLFFIIFLFFL